MAKRHPTILESKIQNFRGSDDRKKKLFLYGMAFTSDNLIVLDERQSSRERLDTIIHEGLHILAQGMFSDSAAEERWVTGAAKTISGTLWRDGFRRIHK